MIALKFQFDFRPLALAVFFDRRRVTTRGRKTCPVLRFPHMPDSTEVHVIDRSVVPLKPGSN